MSDDEAEDFGAFLDSWAQLWEREFERFGAAEDQRLARAAEWARQLAAKGLSSYQEAVGAQLEDSDARARRIAHQAGEVLEVQQAHAVAELREGAAHERHQVCSDARRSADDLVRDITESTAARREAREAKRREEKRAREAAAEARRRQRQAEEASGGARASAGLGGPGGGARGRGASEPPKFTRRPGAHAAAAAAARPGRLDTFAAYELAWGHFEQRVAAALKEGRALDFEDVPWPTLLPSVSGVCAGDSLEVQKEKLRAAVLRWHPDKWGRVLDLVRQDHQAQVMDGVKGVTRRIIEERKRSGRRAA